MSPLTCLCGCGKPRRRSFYGKVYDYASDECAARGPAPGLVNQALEAHLDAILGQDKPLPTKPTRCPRCLGPGKQTVVQVGTALRQTVIKCQAFDRRGGPCQPTITNEEDDLPAEPVKAFLREDKPDPNAHEERVCDICGKAFTILSHRPDKRCSNQCKRLGKLAYQQAYRESNRAKTTPPTREEDPTMPSAIEPIPICAEKGCQRAADTKIFPYKLCDKHQEKLALEAAADVASFHAELRDNVATTQMLCPCKCGRPVKKGKKFATAACAHRGKPRSEETKAKQRAAMQARRERKQQSNGAPLGPAETKPGYGTGGGTTPSGESTYGTPVEPCIWTTGTPEPPITGGTLPYPGFPAPLVDTNAEALAALQATGTLPMSRETIDKSLGEVQRDEVRPLRDVLAEQRKPEPELEPVAIPRIEHRKPFTLARPFLEEDELTAAWALHWFRKLPNDAARKRVYQLSCQMPDVPEVG